MMATTQLLTRTLKVGVEKGIDIDGAKRTVYRGLDIRHKTKRLHTYSGKAESVKETYGKLFVPDVNLLRKDLKLAQNGLFDANLLKICTALEYPDALALDKFQQYYDDHKPLPPQPKYIEPLEGFDSLVKDMWPLYTIARTLGFYDLGTYNGASLLPSKKPSDHATSRLSGRKGRPACAFDAGFHPATGYNNPQARNLFHLMAGNPLVNYVILGDKIWSEERGFHEYINSYDHAGHVHVSGHRR